MERIEYLLRKGLCKEVAERAIKNTPKENLDKKVSSLSDALMHAFIWGDTPEGHLYWQEIWLECSISESKNQQVKS